MFRSIVLIADDFFVPLISKPSLSVISFIVFFSTCKSSSHVLNCPICNSHNTELMPIATDESFRIEYSLTRGMEMEFYKTNKVVIRQQSPNE